MSPTSTKRPKCAKMAVICGTTGELSLTIRRFQLQDLDRILRVEKEAFGRRAWSAGQFRHYADAYHRLFLVAVVDSTIAAYSITRTSENRAELDSIAVAKHYQNRGIGSAFLGSLIRKLQREGFETLSLMVRRDDERAIRFYRDLGFRRIRTVPNYYEGGETAWRMQRALR
jgi:ribosomal-protein-alanine N-acetyltransferase